MKENVRNISEKLEEKQDNMTLNSVNLLELILMKKILVLMMGLVKYINF